MRTYSGYQKDDNGGNNKVKRTSSRMIFAAIGLVLAVYMVIVIVGPDNSPAQPGPGDLSVRIVLHGSVPAVYLVLPPLPAGLEHTERLEAVEILADALSEIYDAEMIEVTTDGVRAVVWR